MTQERFLTGQADAVAEARQRVFEAQARVDAGEPVDDAVVLLDVLHELARHAPACEVAYCAATLWRLPTIVPLGVDGSTREPLSVPVEQSEALRCVIRHWRDRSSDGVTVQAAELGVALEAETWAAFDTWWHSHAVESERPVRGYAGVLDDNAPCAVQRDLPDLGNVTFIRREPAARPARARVITDVEVLNRLGVSDYGTLTPRQVAEALAPSTADSGGWAVWRGATAKPKRVADGLRVCGPDELVTLFPPVGSQWRITVTPGGRHPAFEHDEIPGWLQKDLGVR
jgi:hypothetical protein